jgi:hypothetical protein
LPPVRARLSPARSAEIRRRAKVISSSSPARLPMLSLMRLKRSMSTTSTACPTQSRGVRVAGGFDGSVKARRLGSPVRLSRSISARSVRSACTSAVRSTTDSKARRHAPMVGSGASFSW